jgi:hypothetical protein
MRILRPIVFAKPLLMPIGQSQTLERATVGAQLVGDHNFRHEALLLEQLAHQPADRLSRRRWTSMPRTSPVVDGTPQIHSLAADAHHHLIQMPVIARPRATLAQPCAIAGPNFSIQCRTVS